MRKRATLSLGIALAATGLAYLSATSATATSGGGEGPAATPGHSTTDPSLNTAADWQTSIESETQALIGLARSLPGFGGSEFDNGNRVFVLKGVQVEPLNQLQQLIRRYSKAVTIAWHQVPFADDVLDAAVTSLPLSPTQITGSERDDDNVGITVYAANDSVAVPAAVTVRLPAPLTTYRSGPS